MCLPTVCFRFLLDLGEMVIIALFCVLDPKSDSCNSECGALTATNVVRHVVCRLQCVLPDLTGLLRMMEWRLCGYVFTLLLQERGLP